MCQAASYIYKKLVNDGILNQAFTIAPVRGLKKKTLHFPTVQPVVDVQSAREGDGVKFAAHCEPKIGRGGASS